MPFDAKTLGERNYVTLGTSIGALTPGWLPLLAQVIGTSPCHY